MAVHGLAARPVAVIELELSTRTAIIMSPTATVAGLAIVRLAAPAVAVVDAIVWPRKSAAPTVGALSNRKTIAMEAALASTMARLPSSRCAGRRRTRARPQR